MWLLHVSVRITVEMLNIVLSIDKVLYTYRSYTSGAALRKLHVKKMGEWQTRGRRKRASGRRAPSTRPRGAGVGGRVGGRRRPTRDRRVQLARGRSARVDGLSFQFQTVSRFQRLCHPFLVFPGNGKIQKSLPEAERAERHQPPPAAVSVTAQHTKVQTTIRVRPC